MPKKKKKTAKKTKEKTKSEIVGYYYDGIKTTILRKTRNILGI
jgi:hypothetical protein